MKKNLLVTLSDAGFLNQARQLFSSAYWNGGWDGDYLLLAHGDIPEKDLEWFKEKGITIFRCKPLTKDKWVGQAHHHPVVLDKFYLFTPYFKRWKTVVYLDADVIVRASLKRITDIKEAIFAPNADGIRLRGDFIKQTKDNKNLLKSLLSEYSLRGNAFNSGIMAFDTNIITNTTFYELLSLYNKYGSLNRYGEEPTINLVLNKKWKKLPTIYNLYPSRINKITGIQFKNIKAIILHFVLEELRKPWLPTSPFYEEWLLNFKKSDAMDIKNPQIPAKTWTPWEEKRYEWYLMARRIIEVRYHLLCIKRGIFNITLQSARYIVSQILKMFKFLFLLPDRLIGKIGLLIKKIHPRLYERIRIKHE